MATLLEFEFISTRASGDPFVFLRERSRIAARATGDYVVSEMRGLVAGQVGSLVAAQFGNKIKDAQNVEKMTALAEAIFAAVSDEAFLSRVPEGVRFLLAEIFHGAEAYGYAGMKYALAGNLLVLRCLCPMISVPEYYGVSEKAPSQMARKTLVLQGKILSQIASASAQSESRRAEDMDEQLQPYAPLIAAKQEAYRKIIDRLVENSPATVWHIGKAYQVDGAPEKAGLKKPTADTPLKILREQFPANSPVAGLSFRAIQALHRQLHLLKGQFYDVFQALCFGTAEPTATFSQAVHEARFSRLLAAAVETAAIRGTEELGTLNYLLSVLGEPPPATAEVGLGPAASPDITRPRAYSVQCSGGKKPKAVQIQTLPGSFLAVQGEWRGSDVLLGKLRVEKAPAAQEIDPERLGEMEVPEASQNALQLGLSGDSLLNPEAEKKTTLLFRNALFRDQFLGELFELCFHQNALPAFQATLTAEAFPQGRDLFVVLGKDCLVLLAEDSKQTRIIASLHMARLRAEFQDQTAAFKYIEETDNKIEAEFDLTMPPQRMLHFKKQWTRICELYNGAGAEEEEPDIDKL